MTQCLLQQVTKNCYVCLYHFSKTTLFNCYTKKLFICSFSLTLTSLDFANYPDSEINIYIIFTPRLRPSYIPFRESKLTRLFQPFFCGKGKACMIVNVSQCASTYDETLHVMKFSAVAKQVRKMLYPSQYSEHITYLMLPLLP